MSNKRQQIPTGQTSPQWAALTATAPAQAIRFLRRQSTAGTARGYSIIAHKPGSPTPSPRRVERREEVGGDRVCRCRGREWLWLHVSSSRVRGENTRHHGSLLASRFLSPRTESELRTRYAAHTITQVARNYRRPAGVASAAIHQ